MPRPKGPLAAGVVTSRPDDVDAAVIAVRASVAVVVVAIAAAAAAVAAAVEHAASADTVAEASVATSATAAANPAVAVVVVVVAAVVVAAAVWGTVALLMIPPHAASTHPVEPAAVTQTSTPPLPYYHPQLLLSRSLRRRDRSVPLLYRPELRFASVPLAAPRAASPQRPATHWVPGHPLRAYASSLVVLLLVLLLWLITGKGRTVLWLQCPVQRAVGQFVRRRRRRHFQTHRDHWHLAAVAVVAAVVAAAAVASVGMIAAVAAAADMGRKKVVAILAQASVGTSFCPVRSLHAVCRP